MRTTIAMATFLLVGAGALGASAAIDMKGSDTLKELTQQILGNVLAPNDPSGALPYELDCGGTGDTPAGQLNYIGGGSGNGQSALTGGSQQIAMMSRAMNNGAGICGLADLSKAEGVVHSLDGLSIVGNKNSFSACNGTFDPTCTQDHANGLAGLDPVTITGTSYTTTDWKDVLRILFAGMSTSGDTTHANRNCGSAVRRALAANYNLLFKTCSSGSCPNGIKHVFRRNQESGTTDSFVSLLGLPASDQAGNQEVFCNVGTKGSGATQTAEDALSGAMDTAPFCNEPSLTLTEIGDPLKGAYFSDFQDADVIRRTCDGNGLPSNTTGEDNCSARGDLGLVLPIWDESLILKPLNGDTLFPTQPCDNGAFGAFPAPQVKNCTATADCFARCPNGIREGVDALSTLPAGSCAHPIHVNAGVNDPRCLNRRDNPFSSELGPTPPPAGQCSREDGRVYNNYVFSLLVAPNTFAVAKTPRATGLASPAFANVPMTGSYYRLHQSHTNVPGVFCQNTVGGATVQIGCLVQADPCSIGFAGREASEVVANGTQNAVAFKVNGLDPAPQCIRNLVADVPVGAKYPISRKLYVNTINGFESLAAGDEKKLALCYSDKPSSHPLIFNPKSGSPAGLIELDGFVTIGEQPFCEDFNEKTVCATASNNDACQNNGTTFPLSRAGNCGIAANGTCDAAAVSPLVPTGGACAGSRGAGTCQNVTPYGVNGCICK